MKQKLIIAAMVIGSGFLTAISFSSARPLDLFIIVIPVLMSSVVTGFYCRTQIASCRSIGRGTILACPFLSSLAVILSCSMGVEGLNVFTIGYWSGYRLGPQFMFNIYGLLFAVCGVPALGVAVYYMRQSRKTLMPNKAMQADGAAAPRPDR
jgi:hypothetical protein